MIWIGLAGTGTVARGLWMQAEAPNHIVVADPNGDVLAFPGGNISGGGWRTPDGRTLPMRRPMDGPGRRAGPGRLVDQPPGALYWGVPGDLFPAWDAAETAGYAVGGLLGVGAAFLVVRRRRPHLLCLGGP